MKKLLLWCVMKMVVVVFSIGLFQTSALGLIQGLYRVSNYQIFEDGSFTYAVVIKVFNDNTVLDTNYGNWLFLTNDTNSIRLAHGFWLGPFLPYNGSDPMQSGHVVNGYQRIYGVIVPPRDSVTFEISYRGPSGYWNFGAGEGEFYGDGFGGAETNFLSFYVNLTLPRTATDYHVMAESSLHLLVGSTPIKLRWIEHDVSGIHDDVEFSGAAMTTEYPVITINKVVPASPMTSSTIRFQGYIGFPVGVPYIPPSGTFVVEDPITSISVPVAVNDDGTFEYSTSAVHDIPGGLYAFRFVLSYQDTILRNFFVLPLQDKPDKTVELIDVNYEVSLYNQSLVPVTTNPVCLRAPMTPDPASNTLVASIKPITSGLMSFAKSVWTDKNTSNTNKGALLTTAMACRSNITIPQPVIPVDCGYGVKAVGVGLPKNAFYGTMDGYIDHVPDADLNPAEKAAGKLLMRDATHALIFVVLQHNGGIKYFENSGVFFDNLGKVQIQDIHLLSKLYTPGPSTLDEFSFEFSDVNGDVYAFGVGKTLGNSVRIRSHSPVSLRVFDPVGRRVERGYSEIPDAVYTEDDFDGDGDTDDEIFISHYQQGNYHFEIIPDDIAVPTDEVTLTMTAAWIDSTVVLADHMMIKDLPPLGYQVSAEPRFVPVRLVSPQGIIIKNLPDTTDLYIEIPAGYSLDTITTASTVLNGNHGAIQVDAESTDIDLNGIPEKHLKIRSDSLLNVINIGLGVVDVRIPYDTLLWLQNRSIFKINNLTAAEGWNLVSIPGPEANRSRTDIFPEGISRVFAYEEGYRGQDTMRSGIGYWLNFGSAMDRQLASLAENAETIDVHTNWNLIGSLAESIRVEQLRTIPDNIIISEPFGYEGGGYTPVGSIKPGKGYWLRVKQDGQLILAPEGVLVNRKINSGRTRDANVYSTLVFRDALGRSQRLYFTCDSLSGDDLDHWSLPPVAPGEAFDVRYASNRLLECGSSLNCKEIPVRLGSVHYPLEVRWEAKSSGMLAQLAWGTTKLQLHSKGAVTISSPDAIVRLILGGVPDIPRDFALEQNYPNPFNPITTIRYALPCDAWVTLKIYNLLGEEIITLFDGDQKAGYQSVAWNSLNGSRISVASGVYFYRMVAKSQEKVFTDVKKMISVK